MRYLSLCSGIEAASVAWRSLGWTSVAFSEIDAFPSTVLAHHYPTTPNWGDMTRFKDWPDATVDVLVGGTPCQSFSVAGLRRGLADPRGNLMLVYLAILDRYRPEWMVWENVPGVLSSGEGRDFGAFLGALGQLGYGFAYRVLDAQYFGLAQRRKRVFVVGHLGDWRRAASVLFERESLSGHPAPRREVGQGFAADVAPGLTASGRGVERCGESRGQDPVIAMCLNAHGGSGVGPETECPVIAVCPTLRSGGNRTGGDRPPGTDVDTCESLIPVTAMCLNAGGMGRIDGESETFVPVAFDWQSGGDSRGLDPKPTAQLQRCQVPAVALPRKQECDTFSNKGVTHHGSTEEADAIALLRALREEVGAEAFAQWGLGILDSLQPAEVLRSALHGSRVRLAAFSRRWVVYHALSRPEAHPEGLVCAMREAEREGRASQGWRPSEQLAFQLGAYLSELSQPGPQAARFMRDLWAAGEGVGLLRQALSAVQEVGRSARGERQPICATTAGGGSEPTESVLGIGMPEAASRERILRDARTAGEARDAGQATGDTERASSQTVGRSALQVRRLTVEECEFLQGFPRGYTAIPVGKRGKPAVDGPRYKALGNSMAVPVMAWIGRRIQAVAAMSHDSTEGAA